MNADSKQLADKAIEERGKKQDRNKKLQKQQMIIKTIKKLLHKLTYKDLLIKKIMVY